MGRSNVFELLGPIMVRPSSSHTAGNQMPCALKETAQGGLAMTPTGRRIQADFL